MAAGSRRGRDLRGKEGLVPPQHRVPRLVAGRGAAWVLSGEGIPSWVRETRGAEFDWGGAYGQGVRLTGPWTLEWRESLTATWTRFPGPTSEVRPTDTQVTILSPGTASLAQVTFLVDPVDPRLGCRLRVQNTTPRPAFVEFRFRFQPFLLPVLLEGLHPWEYRTRVRGSALEMIQGPYLLSAEISGGGAEVRNDAPFEGPGASSFPWGILTYKARLEPRGTRETALTIQGGLGRSLHPARPEQGPSEWAPKAGVRRQQEFDAWMAERPTLEVPELPGLERAFRAALGSLEALRFQPEAGLCGLAAGYPWYLALWSRDMAWMLPALLWVGDVDWAVASLETLWRFQTPVDLPALAGRAGEIPMQVGPGPVFLYGTSDSTLHGPSLAWRCWIHSPSARRRQMERWGKPVRRCLDWAQSRCDPVLGLQTNGGEVAEMGRQVARLSSVDCGFEAVDTTIWDSTDRRFHAIDLQVLWARALRGGSRLFDRLGDADVAKAWDLEEDRLRDTIARRYWWPEEGYLYDTLTREGDPVPRVRPNALLAAAEPLLDPPRTRQVVRRALAPDLLTDWGLRTLSSRDPAYDPQAYHDGQVWPIATAWATEAAFRQGLLDEGLRLLRIPAEIGSREDPYANECYRGDRPEPWDSCFLLGLSVGPFLTSVFEGLWGLSLEDEPEVLEVGLSPGLRLRRMALKGLRVRGRVIDLEWSVPDLYGRLRKGDPLKIRRGSEVRRLASSEPIRL
jgi:glycogen debranching enzyme